MTLYTYIVAYDFGFAPNPFYGVCTLATCKPKIRAVARVGDWIVGTGAKTKYNLAGRLVYAMRVAEVLSFDAYWKDVRFRCKRPVLNGSLKQVYGDNIYRREGSGWIQADSHHSHEGGQKNQRNYDRDTGSNRILVGRKFVYYGEDAPLVPPAFRLHELTGEDLCHRTQHHGVRSEQFARAFEEWLENRGQWGLCGMPVEFARHPRARQLPPSGLKRPRTAE